MLLDRLGKSQFVTKTPWDARRRLQMLPGDQDLIMLYLWRFAKKMPIWGAMGDGECEDLHGFPETNSC